MKLPNKAIRYNESVVSTFPYILNALSQGEMSASDLYMAVKARVANISDFLDALDCLYALRKIILNPKTRRLAYVV